MNIKNSTLEYEKIFREINCSNYIKIWKKIFLNLKQIRKRDFKFYNVIKKYYKEEKHWGEIDFENGIFTFIDMRAKAIIDNQEKYQWLLNNLADDESKNTLSFIINYWLDLKSNRLKMMKDQKNDQYFVKDLIKCDKNEVFLDIGCYVGDTLLSYLKNYGDTNYNKIYCFDIVPQNIVEINKLITSRELKNIVVKQVGAGKENGFLYINENKVSPITKLSTTGKIKVNVVKLDDEIKEPATFIKMDIEGYEENALIGCTEIIKKYHPKLAICVYHDYNQLYKIPELINSIDSTYKFYLRYHGDVIFPGEYVLYAV